MSFQLGLLDLNGTLLKDLPVAYAATKELFRRLAPGTNIPTIEEFCAGVSGNMEEWFYKNGIPRYVSRAERQREFGAHYRTLCSNVPLTEGARKFLTFARQCGIPLIIVSAGPKAMHYHLTRLGIEELFESVILEVEEKAAVINDLARRRRLDPQDIFFIGDTVDDIVQGNAAKVATIAYAGGYHSATALRGAKPCHIVNSFDEALAIVRSHEGALA